MHIATPQSVFTSFFVYLFFLYMGFPSRTLTSYRTEERVGDHFFSSTLPLPPTLQTLRHELTQLTFTYSKSTIETLEKGVKYQS